MRKREQKKKETKTTIIKAAVKEFMSKSYDEVRLSDVSINARIAEGTLYNYYPDKTSLFIDVFSSIVTLQKEPILKAHPKTFEELIDAIQSILRFYLELKDEHMRKLFQVFYHKVKEQQLSNDFTAYKKLENLSTYIYLGIEQAMSRIYKKETTTELFPIVKYQINGLHEDYVYNVLSFEQFLEFVRIHLETILRPYSSIK